MKTKFDVYDYLIFVFVLLISIGIGLYFGLNLNQKVNNFFKKLFSKRKVIPQTSDHENVDMQQIQSEETQKSGGDSTHDKQIEPETNSKTSEYLTGNHSMSAFPIALSLLATFFSSSSLLGFPAEVYQYGIQYWMIVFGVCLVPLLGGI